MADPKYALEKLNDGITALAIGEGKIRERLHEAWNAGVALVPAGVLSKDQRKRFDRVAAQLRDPASLAELSTEDAVSLAKDLVALQAEVADAARTAR